MASTGKKYECTLSSALQKKAKKELKEKPEWRDRDIQALRDMVLAHKGLKSNMDDEFLLRFLRARKFDYDRAYDLLINYYTVRAINSEHFKDFTPSGVEHVLDAEISVVLPKRDSEGRTVIYFRPGRWDPSKFDIFDNMRTNAINLEKLIESEETQINGIVFLSDVGGLGMQHAKHFDRNYAKIMASLMQDAFPCRVKAVHFVNEPAAFSVVFAILKPFLKEKLVSRLHFHGANQKSLHKHLKPALLPSELGGTLGSATELAKTWKQEIMAAEADFVAMNQYSIEVSREIIKAKNEEKMDCLAGTYRKLNID